ncbi:MAG: hypothetical protein ACJAS4_000564 [Bacteriovoracaceae bacterium]|jgi:uncharacterized protein YbjT (DUF2867 family)
MKKVALLIGGTGLIGSHLLERLSEDDFYSEIIVLIRNQPSKSLDDNLGSNITFRLIDFSNLNEELKDTRCDDIYCCIGTTIKKAGGQAEFEKVDFTIPLSIGKLLKGNGAKRFFLISSAYANSNSKSFYLKTKGKLEEALKDINFESLIILRPSVLDGNRKEFRFFEEMAIKVGRIFSVIPALDSFTPIKVEKITACLMEKRKLKNKKYTIVESTQIKRIKCEN